MFEEINNHYDTKGVNLLESDDVLSEKKYVLKLNKPKKEKEPEFDLGGDEEGFDFGDEEGGEDSDEEGFDFGDEETDEEGDEEGFDFDTETDGEGDEEGFDFDTETDEDSDEEGFDFGDDEGGDETETQEFDTEGGDEIKNIQSTTGKLGQQLRDIEDLSSDMQKWVVKSVLSALDLDNMETEDKKDIIRAVKKKSKEEAEEESNSFDFGTEGGMEESYDSYMDDEECTHCHGLGVDEFSGETCEWCGGEGKKDMDPNLLTKADIESALRYTSYMGDEDMDDHSGSVPSYDSEGNFLGMERELGDMENTSRYNSYMKDKYSEREISDWLIDMEMAGFGDSPVRDRQSKYDNFMEDESYLRAADLNWDSKKGVDVESDEDDEFDGMDKYFKGEDDTIKEKYHSYMRDTKHSRRYEDNPNIGGDEKDDDKLLFSSKETRNFRLNNRDRLGSNLTPNEKWARHRVPNRTEFEGMDSNMNVLKNTGMKRQMGLGETDDIFANSPAPSKPAPTKDPATKPGKDKPGRQNPSKRPFTPPPHITPGEEPGPKADYDEDVEFE